MTERRKRMREGLQRRGWSARTQERSVRAVRQLAEHDHQPPDVITEEALRQSGLYSTHVKQYSRSASTMARCGIQGFFAYPRHRDWTTRPCVRAPRETKLPVILRPDAGRTILGHVRLLRSRVCRSTSDSWGRRLQEGTPRPVRDIDRARMMIHVRPGQGGTDRDVPLPQRTLALVRPYGGTHRHPRLICPAPGRGHAGLASATTPMPKSRLQEAFRPARTPSGIPTQASVHPRRHSWAPHLLAAGVTLRLIQA